jgi:excisionase family DNA binding protein
MSDVLTIDPAQMSEDEWLSAIQVYVRRARDAGEVVNLHSHPEFLSPEAAGKRLGMSRSTVIRKIETGDIRAIRVGNRHRIPVREFEVYRDKLMAAMITATSDDIESDLYGD